jgi:hypothetical protein
MCILGMVILGSHRYTFKTANGGDAKNEEGEFIFSGSFGCRFVVCGRLRDQGIC